MTVTIVTEAELRQCVGLDEGLVEAIEDCFTWLAQGRVTMPPIMHIDVPEHNGVMDIKSAYVRGKPSFAIKVGSGFFDNHLLGLASSSAMMVVVSAETGFVEAVLLDNGYLTDLRTGAAGAVAARHLAPAKVDTVGVFGAGAQARYQVAALKLVRDFRRLLVRGQAPERVAPYLAEMAAELGVEAVEAGSAEELVRESQVVVTTTPSETPIVEAAWLHPGLHLTAMGSDTPAKQELEAGVLARAPGDRARRADLGRQARARGRRSGHGLRPHRHRGSGYGHRAPGSASGAGAGAGDGDRGLSAPRRRPQARASTLAAMMKSFSCRPLILWVSKITWA
jgi:ornithine cyclodeaminase